MKTDELVAMLARNAEPAGAAARRGRFAAVVGAAALASFVLLLMTLGVRPDLADAARDPMFWVKLGFAAALAGGALLAVRRLALPGRRLAGAPAAIATPVIAMALLAAVVLFGVEPGDRLRLLLGATWKSCPFNITMLSIPGVALLLGLTRGLAPTRPALAGAACGLTAGAVAALVYALHCPEMAAPFIAVWYLLGMLIPAVMGAALGRRLLRW
jgi:hypothetical protein